MPHLKKRKQERNQPQVGTEGSGSVTAIVDPMQRAREWASGVCQLIGAASELSGTSVRYRITPLLSGVTISWECKSLPSRQWLRELEQEIIAFGVCNGMQVWFREH